VSGTGKNSHPIFAIFCDCLTYAQASVGPGIVVKEKDVFRVSVRMCSTDAPSQFVKGFLASLVTCSEVEDGNFTTLV
jgi:hypothetical protein